MSFLFSLHLAKVYGVIECSIRAHSLLQKDVEFFFQRLMQTKNNI